MGKSRFISFNTDRVLRVFEFPTTKYFGFDGLKITTEIRMAKSKTAIETYNNRNSIIQKNLLVEIRKDLLSSLIEFFFIGRLIKCMIDFDGPSHNFGFIEIIHC